MELSPHELSMAVAEHKCDTRTVSENPVNAANGLSP
jgi:hypothetical protein